MKQKKTLQVEKVKKILLVKKARIKMRLIFLGEVLTTKALVAFGIT
jgi:hypothetical protein